MICGDDKDSYALKRFCINWYVGILRFWVAKKSCFSKLRHLLKEEDERVE